MADKTYEKLETDNPILDEIVYNCKLMMKTCLLKDEVAATNAETIESARNAEIYKAIIENRAKIYMFDITIDDCKAAFIPMAYIKKYLGTPEQFPQTYIDKLISYKSEQFMNTFEEKNNYYRKICGLPDYGDQGVYLKDEYFKGKNIYIAIDLDIPVHKMSILQKQALVDSGIIDLVIKDNPNKYYLKHLTKEIDSFTARETVNYGLLYVDPNCESILVNRFKELIEKNRVYIEKVFDFDAYRYYNTYYNRFVMLMIVAQTVIDMVSEIPEYFIRRDVFDIRTCEYFFNANGVTFFPEIPLKYQKKLIQNLNKLIKYKSTEKNIIDICSIFGFENIKIFKYYLMKVHNKDNEGKYLSVENNDLEDVFDLKFVKVPIDDSVNNYYKSSRNHQRYETVVSTDEYWNGPFDGDSIKRQILQQEFNIVQTKYISIDTVYDLTEVSFQMTYFLNTLFYSGIDSKSVRLIVPYINQDNKLPFIDVFMFLFSLMYNYLGVEDVIADAPSQYLTVKGFNFDVDLAELSAYVADKGFTLEELGVDGFTIPENGIFSLPQMISIFINNKKVYNHIKKQLWTSDNKRIYDIYKYLYDSLMVCELNYDNFYIPALERQAKTYSEWLYYNNSIIYSVLLELKGIEDIEERRSAMYSMMNNVSQRIIDWMNTEELDDIFTQFPVENSNYIKKYMQKIISFFKSYKITLLELHTIYTFNEDKIIILDDAVVNRVYDKWLLIKFIDTVEKLLVTFRKDETINIEDVLANIDYTRTYYREYEDKYTSIKDSIAKLSTALYKDDYIEIKEAITDIYRKFYREYTSAIINLDIVAEIIVSLEKKEYINIEDVLANLEYTRIYSRQYEDKYINIKDNIPRLSTALYKDDYIEIKETIIDIYKRFLKKYTSSIINLDIVAEIIVSLEKKEYINIEDVLANIDYARTYSRQYEETFSIKENCEIESYTS